ncbi:acyl-CoA dehydrogenase [Acidihalobacter ferrooxydans]|uniref:Acyl-coenzyme A dehydrogenase n=1 Tax=Acidihalobacter ferrooxydans TaxID=1765967 RepID=A0A1P8UL96_9GAMM|nr:acyl-CoA dehydrogenase [Acidihalobacter ferrooxydans]APZ44514.1 acyl-CoA dehydrogenase [Acidihalobacter ferrooxydans]
MTTLAFIVVAVVWLFASLYFRHRLALAAGLGAGLAVVGWLTPVNVLAAVVVSIIAAVLVALSILPLRRRVLTRPLFAAFAAHLPKLSATEREAIDAGTVGWDGELFSGRPDWRRLVDRPAPALSAEEQAFLDGPVNELCRLSDTWNINHSWNTVPEHISRFVRRNGFLGMIIPKRYGGLELSAYAQSQVLVRLANAGGGVTYLVGVPNSLGPGELLLKYGTEAQKDYYLPRLSSGEEIPCFALTAPTAGSDATSIPDTGVVCRGQWQGREVLGMRLTFNKRYITLAPIATLIGLAFRLRDPEHLLGEESDLGITLALIPRATPGLDIGRRHLPVGDAFLNGPVRGKDIFVPLDDIIGGPAMIGKGWTMLVNCLSVGRAVTLPTGAVAVGKRMLKGSSAYAVLREQFGLSLARFEGVQQPLARIAAFAYIIDAARSLTIQSLDHGEKPSVPSAIVKYHCTELARCCALDAMDIHGGKAVMKGPGNYIVNAFESIPVAITVEGANILTRNLMIFGQGATRSHPFALKEMELAQRVGEPGALAEFDRVLFRHIGATLGNTVRAFGMGLTGARFAAVPGDPSLRRHYQTLDRLSAAFAVAADVAMLGLGGRLKFKESLSARLGDMLSALYLGSLVLKHHENAGCPHSERPAVDWALAYLTHAWQEACVEFLRNYPARGVARALRLLLLPLGARLRGPSDAQSFALAQAVTTDTPLRERLIDGLYDEDGLNNPLTHVDRVFRERLELEPLFQRLREAIKARRIRKLQGVELIKAARRHGVLERDEARRLFAFDARLMEVINVDDFDAADLCRKPYDPADDTCLPDGLRAAV